MIKIDGVLPLSMTSAGSLKFASCELNLSRVGLPSGPWRR